MMEDLSKMLDQEYEETLRAINLAQAGSEEAKWQLQKLSELHKQRMNEIQTASDYLVRTEELRMKEEQLKDGKKDRIVRYVIDGAAILVPVTVSSFWMAKGLKFETTGSFTSRTGQWLSNHMRLFKR